VTSSQVLATAVFLDGKHCQAFPMFGVERRGAPVTAFTRVDDKPILLRCQIYEPDQLLVLDPTLLEAVKITAGLKARGLILINTNRKPASFQGLTSYRVATVDANAIAVRHRLGSPEQPIVNTAILGAFAKASGLVALESVVEAVKEEVPTGAAENVAATREAYEQVQLGSSL